MGKTPKRGIEPRASAWQAEMLPTTPYRMKGHHKRQRKLKDFTKDS